MKEITIQEFFNQVGYKMRDFLAFYTSKKVNENDLYPYKEKQTYEEWEEEFLIYEEGLEDGRSE